MVLNGEEFPHKQISQKPTGKGNPEYYVAEIQPGKMLYEMDGIKWRVDAWGVFVWPPLNCLWEHNLQIGAW